MLIKRYIPLAIVFVFGIMTLATYYIPPKLAQDYYLETMNKWINIVAAFAFLLALLSLFYSHYNKIKRKVDGWGYSIFVYIGFLVVVVCAIKSEGQLMTGPALTSLGWIFRFLYNTLSASMFAVLAYYIVSTAFRSFRIKTLQAFVLFMAALFFIIGKVPLGNVLWNKLFFWTNVSISQVTDWIINVPSVAAKRGIMIGIAVGAIVTSLKIIFGIERQYMGKD